MNKLKITTTKILFSNARIGSVVPAALYERMSNPTVITVSTSVASNARTRADNTTSTTLSTRSRSMKTIVISNTRRTSPTTKSHSTAAISREGTRITTAITCNRRAISTTSICADSISKNNNTTTSNTLERTINDIAISDARITSTSVITTLTTGTKVTVISNVCTSESSNDMSQVSHLRNEQYLSRLNTPRGNNVATDGESGIVVGKKRKASTCERNERQQQ